MNKVIIQKNHIIFRKQKFTIDDLYTSDFVEYSNLNAKKFYDSSYFVNELFISTFQPWMVLKYFINKEKIEEIEFDSPNFKLRALFSDLEDVCNFRILKKGFSFFIYRHAIKAYASLVITSIYLLYRMIVIPKRENIDFHPEKKFILFRTVASEKKLRKFDYPIVFEDFKKKDSVYSKFSVFKRISWVSQSFLTSITQFTEIRKNIKSKVGDNSVVIPYDFYGKRLVHTILYAKILDGYFSLHKNETVFTGNNLDRFSVVEEIVAKKYNIKVICIPHGLEYGFRFPKGFSGDLFYSTTKRASEYFNKMYDTSKFIFDKEIAIKMFSINKPRKNKAREIVFFTEPREIHVNQEIIKELIPLLSGEGMRLSLKLHPKDELGNYRSFSVDFIKDIEDALVGNICFARKSTTLLECIYNESKSAAILVNAKDRSLFNSFPSLQTEEIYIANSTDELFQWIIKNRNNEA